MEPKVEHDKTLVPLISAIIPDGFNQYGQFVWKFYDGDDRLDAVLAVLHKAGVVDKLANIAILDAPNSPRWYWVARSREYSTADYAAATYLWAPEFQSDYRLLSLVADLPDGTAVLDSRCNLKARTIVAREHECWFVGDKFKSVMEAERFVGIAFKSTIQARALRRKRGEDTKYVHFDPPPETTMWQLSSSIELPPMYTSETLRRPTGLPGTDPLPAGARGPGEFLNPGFTDPAQLTYTREAIESVGPFDVANTWEYVLPRRPHMPCRVYSQRFFQFCKKQRIRARFIPLRIIDDEQAGK